MSDRTNRRDFLKTMAVGAGTWMMAKDLRAAPKQKRPNVLLYVVDDQGMGDAGCYGRAVVKTPGLDALAHEGVRFTQAFCTTASCSASRSVILSGLHNHATGQYGHQHDYHHFISFDTVRSLPVLLETAGYRTASMGKYHVAPEQVYHFQQYLKGGGSPQEQADACRSFIEAGGDAPFFLYFCTNEPHRPFKREGMDPVAPKDVTVPPYLPDTPECREELAQYYMSVQRADSGLLRLIDILKKTGRWENTVVLYLSDNGIAFPGAKTNLYEPGMHLLCVIRNPYQEKQGTICNAMISWADLTPTILDFAGAAPTDYSFHGRSFRTIMDRENPEGWDEVYASHTFHEITMYYPMRVVRERRYKLIWNIAYGLDYPFASDLWESATWQGILKSGAKVYGKRSIAAYLRRPKFELYDLENDPDEVKNLADAPNYVGNLQELQKLQELQEKLRAFQKRTGDPWILKWEHE